MRLRLSQEFGRGWDSVFDELRSGLRLDMNPSVIRGELHFDATRNVVHDPDAAQRQLWDGIW